MVAPIKKTCPSIPFGVELIRWVRPQDDGIKTLAMEETTEAASLLVQRIIPVWEGDDPFTVLGGVTSGTLHVWAIYGDPAELKACLARRIAADLSDAFRLMRAFLGQAWSMETGVRLAPEFRREAYDALAEYVDPADLVARFQERFGDGIGSGDLYQFRELPPEERLANEFAFIHAVVVKEKEGKAGGGAEPTPE